MKRTEIEKWLSSIRSGLLERLPEPISTELAEMVRKLDEAIWAEVDEVEEEEIWTEVEGEDE